MIARILAIPTRPPQSKQIKAVSRDLGRVAKRVVAEFPADDDERFVDCNLYNSSLRQDSSSPLAGDPLRFRR